MRVSADDSFKDDSLKTKKSSLRHASRAPTARTVVKGIIGELGRLLAQEKNMPWKLVAIRAG